MTKNAKIILAVILICHSPIKWAAGFLLLLLFPLLKGPKKLQRPELVCVASLGTILIIGVALNIANNQNLWGVLIGGLLLITNFVVIGIYAGRGGMADVTSALKVFTWIQVVAVSAQYLAVVVLTGRLNIFSVDKSYGDLLAGTFGSFSTPLAVTFAFTTIFFFWQYFLTGRVKELMYSFLSILIVVLTGAMSVLILLMPVLIIYLLIKIARSRISKIKKLLMFALLGVCIPSVYFLQVTNFTYASYLYDKMTIKHPPFKIELMSQVFLSSTEPERFILGLGIGNFSSRASLFLTGQYLGNQSLVPVSPSAETQEYIMPYFNVHLRGQTINEYDALSVVSEPFSQYTTLLAEFGVLGFSIFACLFVYLLLSTRCASIEFRTFVILAMLLFLVNSWFEYPSFSAIFFLLMSCCVSFKNEGRKRRFSANFRDYERVR